jgi:type II secretory pathway pseudopilin PulG
MGINSHRDNRAAFTILELLIVIAIIIILAGLILATSGYVQKKGARSRTEAEIAAISAALENYKADSGIYPRDTSTDNINARQDGSAGLTYQSASKFLYGALSGDNENFNYKIDTPAEQQNKTYFTFKPQMLFGSKDSNGNLISVTYLRDPFGNSYGYSTAYQANSSTGYNPTFDLWSTGGKTDNSNPPNQVEWIKNW